MARPFGQLAKVLNNIPTGLKPLAALGMAVNNCVLFDQNSPRLVRSWFAALSEAAEVVQARMTSFSKRIKPCAKPRQHRNEVEPRLI